MNALFAVALVPLVLLLASVIGDVVHVVLHRSEHLPAPLCWPSRLHRAHHRFLDRELRFHDAHFWTNIFAHQLPEMVTRMVASGVVLALLGAPALTVGMVLGFWCADAAGAIRRRGRDRFHPEERPLPPPSSSWWVDAPYHAIHHAHHDACLSAHLKVVDILLGTVTPLAGRRAVVIGGSRFCAEMVEGLEAAGADTLRRDDQAIDDDDLKDIDILMLGHGAYHRDERSYESLIARALAVRTSPVPLDVWALGIDETWEARAAMFDDRIIRRRFRRAPMMGAPASLRLLRRGFRQI